MKRWRWLWLALLWVPAIAGATDQRPRVLIRDAEIELLLRDLAAPLLGTAGIAPEAVRIVLVRDNQLNAFVAGGLNIFINTGLLQQTAHVNQLQGVLAHEIGHIAGGHLIRGRAAVRNASAQAILTALFGVAAGAATGNSAVSAAAVMAGQNIAGRNLLSFSREQESSADAAALQYLDSAQISTRGLLEFFEKLAGQEGLPSDRQVAFVRTHPLTRDRIETIRAHVAQSPQAEAAAAPELVERFARLQAKLAGYLQPEATLLRFSDGDARLTARYARALALYRTGAIDRALTLTAALQASEPANPFFHELAGQIYFEQGKIAEAIAPWRQAVALLPDNALLQIGLARALLATGITTDRAAALTALLAAEQLEPNVPETWRLLATAWGQDGHQALATYALAEEAQAKGETTLARQLAERAVEQLPTISPWRLRAQDIVVHNTEAD